MPTLKGLVVLQLCCYHTGTWKLKRADWNRTMRQLHPGRALEGLEGIMEAGLQTSMTDHALNILGEAFDFSEAALFQLNSIDSDPIILASLVRGDSLPLAGALASEIGPLLPLINSTGKVMFTPSDLLQGERSASRDRKENRKSSGPLAITGVDNAIAIPCHSERDQGWGMLLVLLNMDREALLQARNTDFDWEADLLRLGRILASIIELDQQKNSADRIHRALETISDIGMLLNSSMDATSLIRNVNARICELLEAEGCSVILRDQEAGNLRFFAVWGERSEMIERVSIPEGTGIAGWVINNGTHWISRSTASDDKFSPFVDIVTDFSTRNVLAVPMKVSGRIIGAVEVVNKLGGRNFDDQDVDLLFSLAFQIALLITRSRELTELNSQLKKRETLLTESSAEIQNLRAALEKSENARIQAENQLAQTAESLNQKNMEAGIAGQRAKEMAMALNDMALRLETRDREAAGLRAEVQELVNSMNPPAESDTLKQLAGHFGTIFLKTLKSLASSENMCGILSRGEGGRSFKEREELYEDINEHVRYTRRLVSIAGDLAFFLSGKKLSMSGTPIDMNRVIMDEIPKWLPQAEATGQSVHFVPESSLPLLINGNIDSFAHMLGLLLDNAIRHSRSGQVIFLRTHRDNGTGVLTITDKGRGFDLALSGMALTPFVKLPGTGISAESMGIGLPLARYIAREHGGELTLRTAPGKGVEVEIRLPLS